MSILAQVLVIIVFFSMVGYMVTNPRPLFELYLLVFPPAQRDKATIAFTRISVMVRGWMRANIIGGIMNAVLVTGVNAVEEAVPPVETVYHFRLEPVAVSAVAVPYWQYVTGVVTTGAAGIAFTTTLIAVRSLSQLPEVVERDWLT